MKYKNSVLGGITEHSTLAKVASIASVTHEELFVDFADRFDMECYSAYDECYLYFSDDDICWVEVLFQFHE